MIVSGHSVNAKLLYALLLHRTMLSQKNGWADEEGNVYVIYTIKQMANDMERSERTVQTALRELEEARLLLRRRQGFKKANLLYLLLPDDVQLFAGHDTQDIAGHDAQDIAGHDAQNIAGHDTQNLPASNTDREYTDYSKKKGESPRRRLGEFENVFLSENEYSALRTDYPDRCNAYIQRLSRYMAANDRHYANHCAVLRKWLEEDDRGKAAVSYAYDDYREGECL